MAHDRAEQAKRNFTKHGLTTKPDTQKVYNAWLDIHRKCYNPEAREYCRYGAKGRGIADEWFSDPVAFVDYMLSLPDFNMNKSIERIDNDLGYLRGNLRWATAKEQAHNRCLSTRNTSGTNGIAFRVVDGNTYVTCQWHKLEGGSGNKTFSVIKNGLLPAFKMACDYREKMIAELNANGASYTDKHGK